MPELILIAAIFAVALLYSSVGHGGASGYLAVMALLAVSPEISRPSALTLNVFVSLIAGIGFCRAGYFSIRVFAPFAAASVPFAYVGGHIDLPVSFYRVVLGLVLIVAAGRLAWDFEAERATTGGPNIWIALLAGALIGFLSGLVGVGGGIFLTPLLLLMNWTDARTAAGVSAMFILVNSVSGLAGSYQKVLNFPLEIWLWIAAAIAGAIIGSRLGARRFDSLTLRRLLAGVLVFAGIKLILV